MREASGLTVALVSTQRFWHGGEEQARLLATGLRRRGARVVLFGRRGGEFMRRMAAEGCETFAFGGDGRSPAALWRLRRGLARVRPDVLHYNDSHAMTAAGLASAGLAIPQRVGARRVDFAIRSPRTYRWFCDRLICVSRAVARVCEESGLPRTMLRVVHDGVDPERIGRGDRERGRRSLKLDDRDTLLLCVAKLTDHKGHRFLIDALPRVVPTIPRLVVALAGDGELQEPLRRQAEELGVLPHVRFLGFRQDVPDLIRAADLFVLPSHMEGLCSTLIDVMLARCPIVATTAGGIPDVVGELPGEGPVAWMVPPRDPAALADAILDALASPERSEALRLQAQDRALRRFTADRMVDATLDVYFENRLARR